MVKQLSRAADNLILERLDAVQGLVSEIAKVMKETGLDHKFSIEKINFGYEIKHIGKPKQLRKDIGDLVGDLVWHGDSKLIDIADARNNNVTVLEALMYKLSREGSAFLYNAGEYQGHTLVSAIPQVVKKKVKPNGNAFASVNFDEFSAYDLQRTAFGRIPTTLALAFPIIGMANKGKQQESEIGPKSDLKPEDSYGNAQAPTDEQQLTELRNIVRKTADDLAAGNVSQDSEDEGQTYAEKLAQSKNPAATLSKDYDPRTGNQLTSEQLSEKQRRGIGGAYLSESEENRIEQAKRNTLGLGRPTSLEEKIEAANILGNEDEKKRKRDKLFTHIAVAGTVAALGLSALFGSGVIKYNPYDPPEPNPPGPDNPDKPIDPNHPDWTYKTDIAPSLNQITDKEAVTGQTILVPMHVTDRDIDKYGDKIDRDLKYEDTKQAIKSSKGGNDTSAFEISFDTEGNYLLNASVKDRAGKEDYQTFWANITKKPDVINEKPEITSVRLSPTGKPGEHTLSATATDKDTGVGGIEILLDGKNYNSTNDDNFEKIINEKDFEPGEHTFSAVAWDADDISLRSENNPTADFHANFPPTMDIAVKNIGGDEYEFDIHANGVDNNINAVEVYRTDTDESLLIESPGTKDFVRNVRWDFKEDIGDIPLVFYATDGIADVSVEKTINALNDLMNVEVNVSNTGHDNWRYQINYDAIDNNVKSISVTNAELGINHVIGNVDKKNGTFGGDINASKADNGTYALDILVKDDLGQEFKTNINVVVDDHAVKATYVLTPTQDNKTFSINLIAEKEHSDIKDLIVKLGGDTFEQKREYAGINSRLVQKDETFDASEIAPQDAYISAEIVTEHGVKETLFNESIKIGDSEPYLLDAGVTDYNPINDTLKVKAVAAKDNDTVLQGVDYVIRKAGEQTPLLSGSLDAIDGAFDSKQENATKLIDTSGLANDTYELALIPKSNSVNGLEDIAQFEVNRSYEIIPIFNPDKDATAGSLAWNESARKAELTLVGNNTFFKNWEDEWANVTPAFKAAVLANWSLIDATNPKDAADWLQNQAREHYGGIFTDSDTFNLSRRDFVGVYEKMRDDVLNDPAVPQADKDKWEQDRLTIGNVQTFDPGGSWSRNILSSKLSYDANQNGQLPQNDGGEYVVYGGGFSGMVYSIAKGGTYITEEAEWKANADDPFEPTVWKAFNNFHKTNFTESNFTLDPSVYSALDDQLDDPIGSKYDQLLKLGLMLETWEQAGYTAPLKVSYDAVKQEYTFSV